MTMKKCVGKFCFLIVGFTLTMMTYAQVATNIGNASVVHGNISLSSNAAQTTITQTTNKGIINWDTFDVSAGHTVLFQVPNSSAITLNRINGGSASSIFGNIQSNGQVWLLNSNGIMFGNGSQINVVGLLATTHDILDNDFINSTGNYRFGNVGPGILMNAGNITASSYAILAGYRVGNSGIIEVNAGKIVLGSGNAFSVDFAGDGLLNFEITDSDVGSQIRSNGTIKADGGKIFITAAKANEIIGGVVNVGGLVQADTLNSVNGEIIITAGTIRVPPNTMYTASGADGTHGDGAGTITLKADNVTISAGVKLYANSDYYDGTVTIGDVASTSINTDPTTDVLTAARYQLPPPPPPPAPPAPPPVVPPAPAPAPVVPPVVVVPPAPAPVVVAPAPAPVVTPAPVAQPTTTLPQATTVALQQVYTTTVAQPIQTTVALPVVTPTQTVTTPTVTAPVATPSPAPAVATTTPTITESNVQVTTTSNVTTVSVDTSLPSVQIGEQTIAAVKTPASQEDAKDPVLAAVSTMKPTTGTGIKPKQTPVNVPVIQGILSLETAPPRVSSTLDEIRLSGSGNRSRW